MTLVVIILCYERSAVLAAFIAFLQECKYSNLFEIAYAMVK